MPSGTCKFKIRIKDLEDRETKDEVYNAFYSNQSCRSKVLAVHNTRIRNEDNALEIDGYCYGSVYWSLIADSMTKDRITLMDIVTRYGLTAEMFSSESETGFEEHFIVRGGRNYKYSRRFTYINDKGQVSGGFEPWNWTI